MKIIQLFSLLDFMCLLRRRQLAQSRAYQMVSGTAGRQQTEVVDSVADHVTRLPTSDTRPYFLYDTPNVTSAESPYCCDVTRRSGNPSSRSQMTSRDLLTLEVPTLTSHGAGSHLRLVGGRVDRCCSHLAVLPILPPPPAGTCVTWSDRANQLIDVDDRQ